MIDHEKAVQHVRSFGEADRDDECDRCAYVADMADWAIELERLVIHVRGCMDDHVGGAPGGWAICDQIDAAIAKRPGQEPK